LVSVIIAPNPLFARSCERCIRNRCSNDHLQAEYFRPVILAPGNGSICEPTT
jgi:hypothetical protein